MLENNKIIVGVSGGPDSMALLDLLYQKGYDLICAHVNYLQRDTATRDERIVEEYCNRRGIPFRVKYFDITNFSNFQSEAREFRYNFFRQLYDEYGAGKVALGHHFDDHLETYVFQKRRNMFSDHLGLSEMTEIKGMPIWRPLLDLSKDDLLRYCSDHNILYGIDESNYELDYTRNQIRHDIASLSEDEYEKLIFEFEQEQKEWNDFVERMRQRVNSWETLVPYEAYAKIDTGYRFLYLREWLRQSDVDVFDMSHEYLKEIDRNIMKKAANYQFSDYFLRSSYDTIVIYQKFDYEYVLNDIKTFETDYFVLKNEGEVIQGITLYDSDFPITIRNGRLDDRINLRFGSKRLSRFFVDRKIGHEKRYTWPVVMNAKNEVIFIAGIGCDVHHYSNNPSIFMIEL